MLHFHPTEQPWQQPVQMGKSSSSKYTYRYIIHIHLWPNVIAALMIFTCSVVEIIGFFMESEIDIRDRLRKALRSSILDMTFKL